MMGAGQQRRILESLIPAANQNGLSTSWPEDFAPYAEDWPQVRSRGPRFASLCDIWDKFHIRDFFAFLQDVSNRNPCTRLVAAEGRHKLDKIRFKPLGSFFYSLMVYACGKPFIFPFLFTSSFGMSRRPFVFL
jgi:hypothetical protein